MGMAASQARYLALTSRMNDIEYQGQQINQQRTTLSNQVNALYNSLLEMDVPTPPSTRDFTKVVYSGANGASSFTLGNITPVGTEYNVVLNYQMTGHYMDEAGTTKVVASLPTISVAAVKDSDIKGDTETGYEAGDQLNGNTVDDNTPVMHQVKGSDVTKDKYYTLENGKFIEHITATSKPDANAKVYELVSATNNINGETSDDGNTNDLQNTPSNYNPKTDYKVGDTFTDENYKSIKENQISDYYILNTDGTAKQATTTDFRYQNGAYYFLPNRQYGRQSSIGTHKADNPNYNNGKTVNGAQVMTLEDARASKKITKDATLDDYKKALFDTFPDLVEKGITESEQINEVADKFYVYFTTESGLEIPHFVLKTEVDGALEDQNGESWCSTYSYIANGKYTSSKEEQGCGIEFDAEGRITKISIPIKDKDGNVTSYKTINLEAAEITDDAAYKDAYNKYEYSKHLYDKQQEEINAKTSIIQAEDKNLELKLTRLDHERTAVNTEMEAVKKVIQDNIDKGFKTFSG